MHIRKKKSGALDNLLLQIITSYTDLSLFQAGGRRIPANI